MTNTATTVRKFNNSTAFDITSRDSNGPWVGVNRVTGKAHFSGNTVTVTVFNGGQTRQDIRV